MSHRVVTKPSFQYQCISFICIRTQQMLKSFVSSRHSVMYGSFQVFKWKLGPRHTHHSALGWLADQLVWTVSMKTSRTRYRAEIKPYESNEYFRHGRITCIKCTFCYNLFHLYVAVLTWLYSSLTPPAGSKLTLTALGSNGLHVQPKLFLPPFWLPCYGFTNAEVTQIYFHKDVAMINGNTTHRNHN